MKCTHICILSALVLYYAGVNDVHEGVRKHDRPIPFSFEGPTNTEGAVPRVNHMMFFYTDADYRSMPLFAAACRRSDVITIGREAVTKKLKRSYDEVSLGSQTPLQAVSKNGYDLTSFRYTNEYEELMQHFQAIYNTKKPVEIISLPPTDSRFRVLENLDSRFDSIYSPRIFLGKTPDEIVQSVRRYCANAAAIHALYQEAFSNQLRVLPERIQRDMEVGPQVTSATLFPRTQRSIGLTMQDTNPELAYADTFLSSPPTFRIEAIELSMQQKEIPDEIAARIPLEEWVNDCLIKRLIYDEPNIEEITTWAHSAVSGLSLDEVMSLYEQPNGLRLRLGLFDKKKLMSRFESLCIEKEIPVFEQTDSNKGGVDLSKIEQMFEVFGKLTNPSQPS